MCANLCTFQHNYQQEQPHDIHVKIVCAHIFLDFLNEIV